LRYAHFLACAFVLTATACGSQRRNGAALVVAGAATTAVGAWHASSSRCTSFGCYSAQTPNTTTAPKVAAAGAAIAAAGYALMLTAPHGDVRSRPVISSGPPVNAWRLQRKEPAPPATPIDPSSNAIEGE
jgi:hypothetical protein